MPTMGGDHEQLAAQVARIRASGVLGRSAQMHRLFDFLADCSANGRVPKEVEIAFDAFGRSADFDVAQDAVVRVYVHKLRQRLDTFYSGAGRAELQRVALPKGEYRLTLEAHEPATSPQIAADSARQSTVQRWLAGALVASLVALAYLLWTRPESGVGDDVLRARASPVWSKLLDDDLPILIVLGDYYIVGETDGASSEIRRLVREYVINSRLDLGRYVQERPQSAVTYVDVGLSYLPTAIGPALRKLMPVLSAPNKEIRVLLNSELTADELTQSHIVYVGFFSGLGMLDELVMSGSRYAIGESYDEIVDGKTGHRYSSEAGYYAERGDVKYKDYGYFSTFPGSAGNQIVVIAGTRDTAVINTSEEATNARSLEQIDEQVPATSSAFEALYEVYGLGRTNVNSKLLSATPLGTDAIWGSS